MCTSTQTQGKSLLTGRSSASHLFYSTWSTAGSRPGALTERLVLTVTCSERHLDKRAGISYTMSHLNFPEHYHTCFGRGNPEPSPELLRIWIYLHWLYWIVGALYSSCKEDWQGESWEPCNPFYLKGYRSLINCKSQSQEGVPYILCIQCINVSAIRGDSLHLVIVEQAFHTTTQCYCFIQAQIISSRARHTHTCSTTRANLKIRKAKK